MATGVGSGPSARTPGYKLTWRGATVAKQIDEDVAAAMEELRRDILSYLHSNLHIYTGQMNREAFAEIKVTQGGKRTLVVGSDAPHTIFHEFRYHAQLREALDEWAPKVTQYLQAAFRR